jgi:splicing factor U2AF subunit
MKPLFSQTVMIPHFYKPPKDLNGDPVDDPDAFEDFYEEVLDELMNIGHVEEVNVLENVGDHMFGNVYVKFNLEDDAAQALQKMRGRFFAGRELACEYSPVTDFREARCRQFDEGHCARGGYCNFMHLRHVPRYLRRDLRRHRKTKREVANGGRKRSRSPEGGGDASKRHKADGGGGGGERSASEERRARIASWNTDRETKSEKAPTDAVAFVPATAASGLEAKTTDEDADASAAAATAAVKEETDQTNGANSEPAAAAAAAPSSDLQAKLAEMAAKIAARAAEKPGDDDDDDKDADATTAAAAAVAVDTEAASTEDAGDAVMAEAEAADGSGSGSGDDEGDGDVKTTFEGTEIASMRVADLKAALTKLDIPFSSSAKKADLRALLEQS